MIELDSDEKIIKEVRKHWFAFVSQAFTIIVAAILPFVVVPFLSLLGADISGEFFMPYLFFSAVWLLVLWILFFTLWTNYHLDVLIITTDRVIDIEQFSLFSHDLAEVRYNRIQDVTVEVLGFLPTLLDFGTIQIQTAGETREFVIHYVPHPHEVKDAIAHQGK